MTGTRIRASLFVAVADVFLGASGIILALIVLSSAAEDPRALRQADAHVICVGTKDAEWNLSSMRKDGSLSAPVEIEAFIADVTGNQLLNRIALQIGPTQMRCFEEVAKQARQHNRGLLERGAVSGSLTVGFFPGKAELIENGE